MSLYDDRREDGAVSVGPQVLRPSLTPKELWKLARRFRWDHPLHAAAQALLKGDPSAIGSAEPLLEILSNPSERAWRKRLIASEALRFADLTPEQASRAEWLLVQILANRQVSRSKRLLTRTTRLLQRVGIGILLLAALWALTNGVGEWLNPPTGRADDYVYAEPSVLFLVLAVACGMATLALVLSPVLSVALDNTRFNHLRCVCAAALGRVGRQASVGPLASAANEMGAYEMWQQARPALWNVLARLSAEDYGRVDSAAQTALCGLLDSALGGQLTEDWVWHLLKALDKVGGGPAVASVQRISDKSRRPEWRREAARILPTLLDRQRQEQDAARLLRATSSPETSESLLRAATGSGEQDDLLLRTTVASERSAEVLVPLQQENRT